MEVKVLVNKLIQHQIINLILDPSLFIIPLYLISLIHVLMWTRREEILHVHYMTMPQHKNPYPLGSRNLQFLWTFPWTSLLYPQFV